MIVLGIETSCDETSAAVLVDGQVKSNIISSQLVHQQYGGIVPELASRAHQRLIIPVVNQALSVAQVRKDQLEGVAVTYGPGLMGALLVGLSFAKALAYGLKIPFVGINHMEAHMYSNFINEPKPNYPFLCLIVSGGHTQLVLVREPLHHQLLGETLDDAAGEAYDKVAKMLGLGFPGGPIIDKLAVEGNPEYVRFPRSFLEPDSYDFSFSGIKTSVLYWLRDHNLLMQGDHSPLSPTSGSPWRAGEQATHQLQDLCASFQAAVVDVLIKKTLLAVENLHVKDVAIAGGVSANSELRRRLQIASNEYGFRLFIPEFQYCTDNGAMIAQLGWMKLQRGIKSDFDLNAIPNLNIT
ncbi:MAG: tRNA (adenosine(37)-N6)-threonylcarbamoyltransferase complex transferase subunit TsaD [Ignavibacteriales bacterium]|nr:tRNA (adenosine(37)-N6)-threonylcarbamoyltransferase complex transferase subunit TsaD [Ignavibacteriales bacterium]